MSGYRDLFNSGNNTSSGESGWVHVISYFDIEKIVSKRVWPVAPDAESKY